MNRTVQNCITYLTPDPREMARVAAYHIRNADGPWGQKMLKDIDKLPSSDLFENFLSCEIPRVLRAQRSIRADYLPISRPALSLCSDILGMVKSPIKNPVDKQALMELRDRLLGRVDTMEELNLRLTDRIAAADRSLNAIGKPGPGLFADMEDTAFLLVALKRVAENPLHGPRLLGPTKPRPAFRADFVRMFTVLCSVVGTSVLAVHSGIALGATVCVGLGLGLRSTPSLGGIVTDKLTFLQWPFNTTHFGR